MSKPQNTSLEKIKKSITYRTTEFDKDFLEIFMHEPFLGLISLQITKLADEGCATAYMGIQPNDNDWDFVMGFNPKFMRQFTSEQRKSIICHELYHNIFMHITKRIVQDPKQSQLWNIATDLAINSIIGKDKLPHTFTVEPEFRDPKDPNDDGVRGLLIPGVRPIGKGNPMLMDYIEQAPPLQSADYYFEQMKKLIQNQQQQQGDGDGDGTDGMQTMDDHSGWGEIPPEIEEMMNEKIRDMIEAAGKKSDQTNSWGNIPQEIREMIRKLYSREIDWRSIIKNFIGRCRSIERSSTIKKLSKKLPYFLPGAKRKTFAKFACFIDQSGSMSDKDIAMLFYELEGLSKQTEFDVFYFDTEVDEQSKYTWKRGAPFPVLQRTRCGGTDFNCVARYINKRENKGVYSGVIILTDGYADKMGQIFAPLLWVITEGGTFEAIRPGDLVVKMKSQDNGKFHHKR